MFAFLTADGNGPFAIALLVMLLIALVEGVGLLLGAGLSALADALLPDLDVDFDAPDVDAPGPLTALLGWLYVGRVPFLAVLVLLLTFFGVGGLLLQGVAAALIGQPLPAWMMIVPALLLAAPLTRWSAAGLARLMPGDETEAVSADSFIGRLATLTLATAKPGSPAEARVRDRFRQAHYIQVEPDGSGEFRRGERVLLVRRNGNVFIAIPNPNPVLAEDSRE